MRIAIWHNLPSGGGKRQLYNHVKGLIARGHYVESWCPSTASQDFLPLSELIEEHILPVKINSYGSVIKSYSEVSDILSELDKHCCTCAEEINSKGFDVLFVNTCTFLRTSAIGKHINIPTVLYLGEPYRWFYEAMPELPWLAKLDTLKSPLTFENMEIVIREIAAIQGIRLQARAELEYAKSMDLILVNSVFSRESVLRAYNLESKVCYLGVDTEKYKPTNEKKENYVIGVGTIYNGKGVDRAIRAIGSIDKYLRPDLIWVGNGAWEEDLAKYITLAKDLDVIFTPKINISDEEIISLLSRATAMIYTSRLEPFGLAPLEANACGTTVVGIAESGIKESIKNGVNGFLVNDDNPLELGSIILDLIKNPEKAIEYGQNARNHVIKNWNLEKATDNIENYLISMQNHKKEKSSEFVFFSENKNHKEIISQLYVDIGAGFNEMDSIKKTVSSYERQISFDTSCFENIKGIRFDPLEGISSIFKVNKILVHFNDGSAQTINKYHSNTSIVENDELIFTTDDPQIYFDENLYGKPLNLSIDFEIKALGDECYKLIADIQERKLQSLNESVKEKDKIIEVQKRHILSFDT